MKLKIRCLAASKLQIQSFSSQFIHSLSFFIDRRRLNGMDFPFSLDFQIKALIEGFQWITSVAILAFLCFLFVENKIV